jgi:hypothetical protein
MRRRAFLYGSAAMLAAPVTVEAQQTFSGPCQASFPC